MTDDRELLSALIDGEQVDPDLLSRALQDSANRQLLVDFARLRELARRPVEAPEAAWQFAVSRSVFASRWARAAAVLLALGTGAGAGAWVERYVSRDRPPEPARVVQFDPVFTQ
jgi:hypothetical protein